jgi:hypothetical protein
MLDKSKAELWFASFRGDCPIHEAAQGGHCGKYNQARLFNANSAIFQLYHGENKLIINEMMMFALF